jgi:hypothetical protein
MSRWRGGWKWRGGTKPGDAGIHAPVISSGSIEPKWGGPGSGVTTPAWLEDERA